MSKCLKHEEPILCLRVKAERFEGIECNQCFQNMLRQDKIDSELANKITTIEVFLEYFLKSIIEAYNKMKEDLYETLTCLRQELNKQKDLKNMSSNITKQTVKVQMKYLSQKYFGLLIDKYLNGIQDQKQIDLNLKKLLEENSKKQLNPIRIKPKQPSTAFKSPEKKLPPQTISQNQQNKQMQKLTLNQPTPQSFAQKTNQPFKHQQYNTKTTESCFQRGNKINDSRDDFEQIINSRAGFHKPVQSKTLSSSKKIP